MARLKLNKSGLAEERTQLDLCKRTLPSLDLKRRQLSVELAKARRAQVEARVAVDALETRVGEELPMLANPDIEVRGLVKMTAFELDEENVVGVRLPRLARVECEVADYSLLARPAWVDLVVDRLKEVAEERTRLLVLAERERILEFHERRTTQRVNLFEQILIPTAKRNIQRIRIFLGDAERAAVVRSKLAKAKQEKARRAALGGGAAT
ncbi:MAG: V-type ATP synthase subunit D [Deltaproteobacteria bacterium]|nr:V-type ATP synthase subunit D [Deltaproteobacteria bacterium]